MNKLLFSSSSVILLVVQIAWCRKDVERMGLEVGVEYGVDCRGVCGCGGEKIQIQQA